MGYHFDLTDYQHFLTHKYSPTFNNVNQSDAERELVLWLGLMGETGELAEKIKKLKRGDFEFANDDEKSVFEAQLMLEFGDIIAYLTLLMSKYKINLETAIIANQGKLEARLANNTQHGSGDLR